MLASRGARRKELDSQSGLPLMAVGLAIASAIVWVLVALGGCSIPKSSPDYSWGGQSSVGPPDTVCIAGPTAMGGDRCRAGP